MSQLVHVVKGRTARFIVAPYGDGRKADFYCAGATGNQVEINQAIVAANALLDGGVVDLLDGEYTLTASITPLNNVWLRGQGMFNTKLKMTNSANAHIIDNYSLHNASTPWQNAIISDLELDGSTMNPAQSSKGLNSNCLVNCKFFRLYVHDTTATGLGADDFYGVTMSECLVMNCGYVNKRTITAASWSANTLTITANAHGYSIGSSITITGMTPLAYNGKYLVTTVVDANNFTIGTSNNSNTNNLTVDPGTATVFGYSSDYLIGHNGIGIASGAYASEANIITNNICIGNQNNNFLIEADDNLTGSNASYIFSNNISMFAGQCGYLNTGTPNTQFNNNYDYGSQFGGQMNQVSVTRTITAASWSGSVATFTTSVAHGYASGNKVSIGGMTPTGYNGYYTITGVTSTTFTVAISVNPGTATVFGSASVVVHGVDGSSFINNIFLNNGLHGIRLPTLSNGVIVTNNVLKGCLNYGIQTNSSNTSITGNRIYNNGRSGVYVITGSGDNAPMQRVSINGNFIYNNSNRVASTDGIEVSASTSAEIRDILINNNIIYDDQDTKTQRYGVILRSGGTMTNIAVSNNDLSGNLTGGILVQNTSETITAINNIGATPTTGVIFTGKATNSIGNVTAATSVFPTSFTGTKTLPANYLIPGKTIRISIKGNYTTALTTTNATVAVKLGSTTIATVTVTSIASATNLPFTGEVDITCYTVGASGTVAIGGGVQFITGLTTMAFGDLSNGAATVTVDTTASKVIDVVANFGTSVATQDIDTMTSTIEILN